VSVWDEVVGQEQVVATLRDAVAAARSGGPGMSHAWLVTGPPGSGRSVAARAFAAALQCTDPDEPGCGHCQGCTTALAGTHGDVTLVGTEKVIFSIDEIRPLVSQAQRAPSQGRWRVMLMEDADRMVERTSNVLLKAIEEPPPRTVWLLCAPSPEDVLTTIRSRCRAVHLRVPDPRAVADLLVRRDGLPADVALAAARAAQSHIGLARRLARDPEARERRRRLLAVPTSIRGVGDAVLAAADLIEISTVDARRATEERDAAERAELLRTLGADAGSRLPPALRGQVKTLEDDQKRRATRAQRDVLDRAMVDLLSLYRDVLVVQLGADVDLVNTDAAEEVRRLAAGSTPEQSVRRMDAVGVARERLAANVAPLLAVEAMMVALRPQG
jgi:DNA polymerase-3 subunit delta'